MVDAAGNLVADPDIGLVLRKTSLAALAHVRAPVGDRRADDPALVSHDLAGTRVLTAVAPITALGWRVFVEQPVAEVYARLDAAILRTALLLLGGLALSALAAWRWRAAWCGRSVRWTKAPAASALATWHNRSTCTQATNWKHWPNSSTA